MHPAWGRALLVGMALACATAAQRGVDPVDSSSPAAVITAADAAPEPPHARPPALTVGLAVPVIVPIVVSIEHADRVRPPQPTALPPLWVAPKTSPPQA